MRLTASVAVACGLLLTVPCLAATVDSVRGQVSINRGDGFRRVTGTIQANTGDSVMVSPKGRARVVYPDGCALNVDPGAVVTITAQSPCKSFAQATGDQSDDRRRFAVGPGGTIIVGGWIAQTILILLDDKDNAQRPASP